MLESQSQATIVANPSLAKKLTTLQKATSQKPAKFSVKPHQIVKS